MVAPPCAFNRIRPGPLQDEGRLVVPPAFAAAQPMGYATTLVFALTGDSRFSYGRNLCENYAGEGDFITGLIVSHYPTTL